MVDVLRARARELNVENLKRAARPQRHHDDPVREERGLVDGVREEQHRVPMFGGVSSAHYFLPAVGMFHGNYQQWPNIPTGSVGRQAAGGPRRTDPARAGEPGRENDRHGSATA